MRSEIRKNRETLKSLFDEIVVSDSRGANISLDEAVEELVEKIVRRSRYGGKLLFVGNGGSASIASHMATDFVKNVNIPALAFNDSSLLTCLGNDLGYESVFERPVGMFASRKDLLIAISSSGRSQNILRAVSAARKRQAEIVTLSGFDGSNPLRKMGKINFYVPSKSYGHVEILHLMLCHSLVDAMAKVNDG